MITGSVIAPEDASAASPPDRGDEELLRVEGMTMPGIVKDASFS